MERPDRNPKAGAVARWSVVVVFLLLGVMRMLEGGDAFAVVLVDHVLLPDAAGELGPVLAVVVGTLQVGIAVTLAFAWRAQKAVAVASLLGFVLAAIPLTLLFTNPVWISELGGFPAIGSGQGLIKYLAIMGLARFVHANVTGDETGVRHAKLMLILGLLVPLVWIGGMKFTAIETRGIEPLLSSSPLFAWMLNTFSLRTASVVIGVAELITAVLLAAWWVDHRVFRVGALLAIGTFLGTLSFLITLPGWHATMGFPFLNGAGIFLIKDAALLAAVGVLFLENEFHEAQ